MGGIRKGGGASAWLLAPGRAAPPVPAARGAGGRSSPAGSGGGPGQTLTWRGACTAPVFGRLPPARRGCEAGKERAEISPPARHPALGGPTRSSPRRNSLNASTAMPAGGATPRPAPHSPRRVRGRSAVPPRPARAPRAAKRAQTCGPRAEPSGKGWAAFRTGRRRRAASSPAGAARAGGDGSSTPALRPPSSAGSRPLAQPCPPRPRRLL